MNLTRLVHHIERTLPAARIIITPLPLCPELQLYLISPDNMHQAFAADEIQRILQNTPYWTFCWASGQALAYYILHNKERFAGKCILDFGAGSGVVAIAAALAGAARVIACDIDPDALDAVRANAALNNVQVDTCAALEQITDPLELIIAADVLYDRENFHYLQEFLSLAPEILVADSRVNNLALPPYRKIAAITATTLPDLDAFEECQRIAIYRAAGTRKPL